MQTSPGAAGLLTPLSYQQHAASAQGPDRDEGPTQSTAWGDDPSPSTAPPARSTQALPSPAETLASGVSWGPPPADSGAYLRPQWQPMPAPHSLYPPPPPASHTPLPSLANDPRFYAPNPYTHYPPVNLAPPGAPADAHDAFRYQADYSLHPPPLPSLASVDGSTDARHSTLSAITPPASNPTSGASSARDDERPPPAKRAKHETGPSGVMTTQTGKIIKTDRPFGCDVCSQSFVRPSAISLVELAGRLSLTSPLVLRPPARTGGTT